jgi:hypothetical protein
MLQIAKQHSTGSAANVRLVQASYESLSRDCGTGFDGVYCIGNSLAAAGTAAGVAKTIQQFVACLRIGGRLFVQILNFTPMRREVPCVRGPRIASVEGRDYVSVRQFHFFDADAQVTNITIWQENGEWRQLGHAGRLYPLEREELLALCEEAGLHTDAIWGSYAKEPFDVQNSADLILVATRR